VGNGRSSPKTICYPVRPLPLMFSKDGRFYA
jgi:hypothetical protein